MWAKALDTMLRQLVQHGRLEVTYTDGTKRRYGNGPGDPVRVRLSGEKTERRLAMHPNLAVGEAYVDGHLTVEGEDIAGLIALALCADQPRRTLTRQRPPPL